MIQDKIFCVTGANSGIGKATALGLARQGAQVIMGCRNLEKGELARREIISQTGNDRIDLLPVDLADFDSIRAFARDLTGRVPRLDVLVNNAGIYFNSFQTTRQGFEYLIGANHFGTFLLTTSLLDHLRKSEKPRVVTVSSAGHYGGAIRFETFREKPDKYLGFKAYSQSKLANVLFAAELARRAPDIESYSLHPGVVATNFITPEKNRWLYPLWRIAPLLLWSAEKGARTSLYLATQPELKVPNGQYFDEYQTPRRPSKLAQDPDLARKLWEHTEEWIGKY